MNLVIRNKKKKRIEALIELKKEAIDKFIITSNKSKFENIGDCSLNEHINNEHIDENENREEILVNEQDYIDYHTHNDTTTNLIFYDTCSTTVLWELPLKVKQ